ncbi:MAG: ATP-binding cassette domain-containing protein, partial [Comamonas sp.]
GLIDPPGRISSGTVELDGERIDGLRGEAMRRIRGRRIGSIFQDPLTSLNPVYTVGRHLVETIRTHLPLTEAQARARALELLEEVEIPEARVRLGQYPHQFSGGQRQRIGIARALAVQPRFIVADEPLSALDVSIQAQVVNLLGDLKDRLGLTLLFISHDLDVVEYLCDRVVVLYLGRVVEVAPTEAL